MKTAHKVFNRHTYRTTGTDLVAIIESARNQAAKIRQSPGLIDIEFDDGSIIVARGSVIICDVIRRAPYPYAYA